MKIANSKPTKKNTHILRSNSPLNTKPLPSFVSGGGKGRMACSRIPANPVYSFPTANRNDAHRNRHNYFTFTSFAPILSPYQVHPLSLPSSFSTRLNCRGGEISDDSLSSSAAAYAVLGVEPNCSATQLKAAFRAKVRYLIILFLS